MNPKLFCSRVCKKAKEAGHGLRMAKTPEGWSWAWSNGDEGHITAHTQQVALVAACEAYLHPIINIKKTQ